MIGSIWVCEGFILEEVVIFQVFFDDDVGDSVEDKFDVLRVGGVRYMGIDFFYVVSYVEFEELYFDVVVCVFVGVGFWWGRGLLFFVDFFCSVVWGVQVEVECGVGVLFGGWVGGGGFIVVVWEVDVEVCFFYFF